MKPIGKHFNVLVSVFQSYNVNVVTTNVLELDIEANIKLVIYKLIDHSVIMK